MNVAATRAKFRFYMIGDKNVWMCKPVRVAREYIKEIILGKDIDEMLGITVEKELLDFSVFSSQDKESITNASTKDGNSKQENTDSQVCPKCGKSLVERNGKFGRFLGCTGFPGCNYTKSV